MTASMVLAGLAATTTGGWTLTARSWWQARQRLLVDSGSGLANRESLGRAVARLRRQDSAIGVLLLDLDRFKQINDRHGHEVGNHVIREIAGRLRAATDHRELPVRLHGDEFAVLLDALPVGDAGQDIAHRRAHEIAEQLTGSVMTGKGPVMVSASVGSAVLPAAHADLSTLLTLADAAMYGAKSTRRTERANQAA
jgi:diguanylate cyclase (GGDEF)-like protein